MHRSHRSRFSLHAFPFFVSPATHWLGNEDMARYGTHFRDRDCKRNTRTLNRSEQRADVPISLQVDAGRLAAGVVVTSSKSDMKISHCACLAYYLPDD